MEFLRQLTFESVHWTKNFDTFETVSYEDDDDDCVSDVENEPSPSTCEVAVEEVLLDPSPSTYDVTVEEVPHVPIVLLRNKKKRTQDNLDEVGAAHVVVPRRKKKSALVESDKDNVANVAQTESTSRKRKKRSAIVEPDNENVLSQKRKTKTKSKRQ